MKKIAVAIAVTLHDVLILAMPAVYLVKVQTRLVDVVSSSAGPRALRAFRIALLFELAALFPNRLARVGRLAFPGSAVRLDCLFFDALAA